MVQRWISVVLTGLATCSAAISEAAEPIPSGWRTYKSQVLGISIRHPPLMSVHSGDGTAFQGFIIWPRPNLRIALPTSSFEGTHVIDAAVVIYAPSDEGCPPLLPDQIETQALSGRPFYHWTWGEGAGGHTISAEFFCVMYRDKPFAIAAVMQNYRFDGDETKDFVKRAEARRQAIAALLMQVLKTLILTDTISNPKSERWSSTLPNIRVESDAVNRHAVSCCHEVGGAHADRQ